MLADFVKAFIPLFVAIDVIGILPIFLALTSRSDLRTRRRLGRQAVMTAFVLAIAIMLTGKYVFRFLGITLSDVRIAGGIVLLIISVKDLLSAGEAESKMPADLEHIGVVPLGIPLILGPAVLTTLLILMDSRGFALTLVSLLANLVLVAIAFYCSDAIQKLIGRNGALAFGKVASLLLAAIAVMMVRVGLMELGVIKPV